MNRITELRYQLADAEKEQEALINRIATLEHKLSHQENKIKQIWDEIHHLDKEKK